MPGYAFGGGTHRSSGRAVAPAGIDHSNAEKGRRGTTRGYACRVMRVPVVILLLLTAALALGEQDAASPPPRQALALEALSAGRFVRARHLAEALLAEDEADPVAHFVLGAALHEGEGNIPLALNHYRRAETLVTDELGNPLPGQDSWLQRILLRKLTALSDLGRYEELLRLTARYRRLYEPDFYSVDIWPLMKLGRIEAARRAAALALGSDSEIGEVIARNGLCALDGYQACKVMLDAVKKAQLPPAVALRNLGVAAVTAGRYDEAEQLLLEATSHPDPDINPWRDLASLYAAEGRLAEAIETARKMAEYGRRLPPRQKQYSRAEELAVSGLLLLLAGHPERALPLLEQALDQPDRDSHWSGSAEEVNSEAVLALRTTMETLAERLEERASIETWSRAWRPALGAVQMRARAWRVGRRLLPLLAAGGLRPSETAEDISRPELSGTGWLVLDGVALMGSGPTLGLVRDLLADGPPAGSHLPREIRDGFLRALETEALWLRGQWEAVADAGAAARRLLPAAERLLQLRLAARMADAAWRAGDFEQAASLYDEVLAVDPAMLRRLGQALPLQPRTPTRAASLAAGTPRFVLDARALWRIDDDGRRLCLSTVGGSRIACATDPGPTEAGSQTTPPRRVVPWGQWLDPGSLLDTDRRRAAALLETAFAPRVDLSQSTLDSLDAATGVDRAVDSEALDEILDSADR